MAARKHLLTFSSLKSYDGCPRRYYLGYQLGYRARHPAEPLVFGTLIHACLEAYWKARQRHPNATDKELWAQACMAALEAEYRRGVFGAPTTIPAQISRARAAAMLIAYRAVWDTVECTVLAVEIAFRAPLMHPDTHVVSELFERGGKIDAIIKLADGRVAILEHKGLAADMSVGSARRRMLTTDEQVSYYWVGATTLGFKPDVVIYDVLSKPSEKPLLATPQDKRVYVTDRVTKEKRLKATQRALDETPDEYLVRMLRGVVKEPEKWITRIEVVRLASERRRFALEVIQRARFIEVSLAEDAWPRKSGACYAYGSGCEFLPHCSEGVSLEEPKLFRRIDPERPHEELV